MFPRLRWHPLEFTYADVPAKAMQRSSRRGDN
jgi:hypothetical protein